jgi:hypothetical protein
MQHLDVSGAVVLYIQDARCLKVKGDSILTSWLGPVGMITNIANVNATMYKSRHEVYTLTFVFLT